MRTDKKLIYFLIYWIIYSGLIVQYIWSNKLINFVPDIIVFYLWFTSWEKKYNIPIKHYIGKVIPIIIVFFIAVGVFSDLLNEQPLLNCLFGLRNYIRYFVLFIVIHKTFNLNDVLKTKDIYIQGLKYNLLFVIFQSLVLGIRGDLLGGTFSGGNSDLYLFILPGIFMLSCDYFQKRIKISTLFLYTAGIIYFALVGEVKIIYFTIPLIIYGAYVLIKRFCISHIVTLIFGFIFIIPLLQYLMGFYYSQDYINKVFELDEIDRYTNNKGFGEFNRGTAITLSNSILLTDTQHRLLGYGFNSASTSDIFVSPLSNIYSYISGFQYFSTSYLLAETGWIGFILFIVGHILLFSRFYMFYCKYTKDPIIKNWSTVGLLSVAMTFLLIWFNNSPVCGYYLMYILWAIIFLSIKFRVQYLTRKRKSVNS